MSNDLLEKIDFILEKNFADRHSFFQLQNFVVNNEHTHQGKLWQVYRELKSRKEAILSLENQLLDAKDELEILELKIKLNENLINKKKEHIKSKIRLIMNRKLERQYTNLSISINQIKEKIQYIKEEAEFLVCMFDELSKKEEMKPLDDLESQVNYWNAKLTQEYNLQLITNGRISPDLLRTILCLDGKSLLKKEVESLLKENMNLLNAKKNTNLLETKK